MTEFEAASLAVREAALTATYLQATVAAAVGLGQLVAILYGIHRMGRASDQREKREDQRHTEAMATLDTQRRALETLIKGMETVIERTGGRA